MPAKDSLLNAVSETNGRIASVAIDEGLQAFMGNINDSDCPSSAELQSAMNVASRKLGDRLFDRDTLKMLIGEETPNDEQVAAIKLQFQRIVTPLKAPSLPVQNEMLPMRLALAALLGAVLGMLIGSPVGIYLLGTRDFGLLLGAPLGAFLMTWALDLASRSKLVSNALIGAATFATVAELWAYLSINPFAALWRRLSGNTAISLIQRIAVYLLVIVLLVFSRRRATYDRTMLEQSVRQTIAHWLPGALLTIAVLTEKKTRDESVGRGEADAIAELGKRIMEMHAASAENLSGLAEDVINAARKAGYEGLEAPAAFADRSIHREAPAFEWAESMRERYNVFGHVEPGDRVRAEEEPVIFGGRVSKKGLVRKQRGQ